MLKIFNGVSTVFNLVFLRSFEHVPSWFTPMQWGIVVRIIYVAVSSLAFVTAAYGLRDVSPGQFLFLRSIGMFVIIAPTLIRHSAKSVITYNWKLHLLANIIAAVSSFLWFSALTMMPLSMVSAISFLTPILAVVGAFFILRETYTHYLLVSIILAFIGAEIVVSSAWGHTPMLALFFMLSQVVAGALFAIVNRFILLKDTPAVAMFYHVFFLSLIFAVPAYFLWTPLSSTQWLFVVLFVTLTFFMFRANFVSLHLAPFSVVIPFDFSLLMFAGLWDFLLRGVFPPLTLWVGGSIIFVGMLLGLVHQRRITPVHVKTEEELMAESLDAGLTGEGSSVGRL